MGLLFRYSDDSAGSADRQHTSAQTDRALCARRSVFKLGRQASIPLPLKTVYPLEHRDSSDSSGHAAAMRTTSDNGMTVPSRTSVLKLASHGTTSPTLAYGHSANGLCDRFSDVNAGRWRHCASSHSDGHVSAFRLKSNSVTFENTASGTPDTLPAAVIPAPCSDRMRFPASARELVVGDADGSKYLSHSASAKLTVAPIVDDMESQRLGGSNKQTEGVPNGDVRVTQVLNLCAAVFAIGAGGFCSEWFPLIAPCSVSSRARTACVY